MDVLCRTLEPSGAYYPTWKGAQALAVQDEELNGQSGTFHASCLGGGLRSNVWTRRRLRL